MKQVKELNVREIDALVDEHLPHITCDVLSHGLSKGDLHFEDYLKYALETIRLEGFIEDALNLLSPDESYYQSRESVTYSVRSAKIKDDVHFEVVNTTMRGPSPRGYMGYLFIQNKEGHEEKQLILANITLNPEYKS